MIKLIYANTKNSEMYYAVKMQIPDAFFWIDTGNKKYVFLDHREFKVFQEKNKNKNIELLLLNDYLKKAENNQEKIPTSHKLAFLLMEKFCIKDKIIEVPISFPLDLADFLKDKGFEVRPVRDFFSKRIQKNSQEIKEIKKSIQLNYLAFEKIEEILKNSSIKGNKIIYKSKILTSEFLKQEVEWLLFKNRMITSQGLIISSGEQTVIPHHMGEGPILANQTIICDIFPQHRDSGYFADMTRTYFKGEPSAEIKKIYNTVLEAQETAIKMIKPGIKAYKIHQACVKIILDNGFDVGNKGFVHNTGHGIGIDIHEEPYLKNDSETVLREGQVFTVEPGLYYQGLGGVRIEDNILVTKKGYENLTNYPKKFIIK
jgi:Xaa-Pro aminopeptidase